MCDASAEVSSVHMYVYIRNSCLSLNSDVTDWVTACDQYFNLMTSVSLTDGRTD